MDRRAITVLAWLGVILVPEGCKLGPSALHESPEGVEQGIRALLQAPPAQVESAVQERIAQLRDDTLSVRRRSALVLKGASGVLSSDQRRLVVEELLAALERTAREHNELGAARPKDKLGRRRLEEFMPARADIRGAIAGIEHDDMTYPALAAAIGQQDAGEVAAKILVEAWPHSKAAVRDALASMRTENTLPLFIQAAERTPNVPREKLLALARYFARHHESERVRALALTFSVPEGWEGEKSLFDASLLSEAYEKDESLLVRRTAIRTAAHLGDIPGNLDLRRLVLEEQEPLLRKEAIEARAFWRVHRQFWWGFVLWDDFVCSWLFPKRQGSRSHGEAHEWSRLTIARLQQMLDDVDTPYLRDAISMAIADRYRGAWSRSRPGDRRPAELTNRSPLRVHEWGVWRDASDEIVPAEKVLAELPDFVHRARTRPEKHWAQRSYSPSIVTKPVLFFYTPEPVSLLVQVRFFEGMPWVFFPEATDYLETQAVAARRRRPLAERATVPPWLPKLEGGRAAVPRPAAGGRRVTIQSIRDVTAPATGELRQRYRIARWLWPHHRAIADRSGAGPMHLDSVGLEWCGLRVGYPARLELPLPEVDEDSWWSRLRQVPSDAVAVRGEAEKFLFYDGAVNIRSPVNAWRNRDVLTLSVKPFDAYPDDARWPIPRRSKRSRSQIVPWVYVLSKKKNQPLAGQVVSHLPVGGKPERLRLDALDLRGDALADSFHEDLIAAGLTKEESAALLGTFDKEFFATEGVRVVSLLPQWLYDVAVPLDIWPRPSELVRVALVWKEL